MVAFPKTINQQWFRIGLLIALLGGVGVSLGRSLLLSKMGAPVGVSAIALPANVPLSGWQLVSSQALQEQSLKALKQIIPGTTTNASQKTIPVFAQTPVAGGRSYRYQQGSRSLQVEVRSLTNTQGDVPGLLAAHPAGDFNTQRPTITQREHASIGTYGMFTMQGKTYLSSCINPQGQTTFTRPQFINYHLRADLTPQHVWQWFLNRAEIPDRRCVWVYMWTANSPAPSLEADWFAWYTAWQTRVLQ